ncbi:30S ribosomal protein S21 [Hibiscus syriacus]|uniref:30S ribosomal protein S21 n=1 Tax=Hibiscus syriacus TaxID=106335 RepID=A0A6A3BTW7_HIBSY|nr:30S ribosomal protein S21 [Hibiscus syriacus]
MSPSLAYANTLFFRSAYNVQVIMDDNEPEERLLNRFRRDVMRAGVIQVCKRRKFFENKQDDKKRKSREAAKRNRRRHDNIIVSENPLKQDS